MPVEFKDYYRILDVSRSATDEEIKKSFRALARKYHPDVAKDKRSGEERFKEINEAYEVLSHPGSRQKYDELGASWRAGAESSRPHGDTAGPAPGGTHGNAEGGFRFEGTGFSDFFEQFFGGRGGRGGGGSTFSGRWPGEEAGGTEGGEEAAFRGEDIRGDILITLDEVLQGTVRAISVRRINTRSGREETETYRVRVPAGVRAGQTIRVAGKGGEGSGGGGAGDIYLRVRFEQHPEWRVRGVDLLGQLELAPWEAVLGATVPVRTLEASVSVKVPAGTQQGRQLRVRGMGLPAGGTRRGDLYLEISIHVPSRITPEEERLWKELAARSTYDPRSTDGADGSPGPLVG